MTRAEYEQRLKQLKQELFVAEHRLDAIEPGADGYEDAMRQTIAAQDALRALDEEFFG